MVVAVFLVCGLARTRLARRAVDGRGGTPATIVSLAPSLTETAFALGAGERVVGVTRYCTYPPEARSRQETGGYFDPNYEAILRLRPDLVLALEEHADARDRLAAAGLRVHVVNHKSIEGILDSITSIGDALGLPGPAAELSAGLRVRADTVRADAMRASAAEGDRPRVLIVVDRTVGTGVPGKMYICGRDEFFAPMLGWAGGENAYDGPDIDYPMVSPEGLLAMDPDIIIDLIPSTAGPETRLAARADWKGMPGLRAQADGRVHVWNEDYTMVPGPRFILALERLAEVLQGPDLTLDGQVGLGVSPGRDHVTRPPARPTGDGQPYPLPGRDHVTRTPARPTGDGQPYPLPGRDHVTRPPARPSRGLS